MRRDTIAAIATPLVRSAIGIVRVSGPAAPAIAAKIFRWHRGGLCPFESHRLYLGDIVCPKTGALIDEALVVLMREPRSYTGEDSLEIQGHGGPLIMQRILRAVLEAGGRPAEPGEFTRRAFLNNRLDLSRAEAVAQIIDARTEGGLDIALSQLKGEMAAVIEDLRGRILELMAILEADVDFDEHDLDSQDVHRHRSAGLEERIRSLKNRLAELLATYEQGKRLTAGVSVMILGRPNVGKSSLLNALLGKKRAIVTPIAGTTRDLVEDTMQIGDRVLQIVDTAGIRQTDDLIEKEGLEMVKKRTSAADMVIVVLDGSEELQKTDWEILEANRQLPTIIFINKSDLPLRVTPADLNRPDTICLQGSAKMNLQIEELKTALDTLLSRDNRVSQSGLFVATLRHKLALEKAALYLDQALTALAQTLSPELLLFELRLAAEALAEITGKIESEEVLEQIFSTFCVGK